MNSNQPNNASPGEVSHQDVVFFPKAHSELLKGATILANAVKSTMGPSGHSVVIDMETGPPLITKDGVTVAKSINLKDRLQSMGAELLKEVAGKTNELAGDGPQPLYAKVLTPRGWTTMGDLKVDDIICGTDGTAQKVVGIYYKGLKDIYKVTLSDGRTGTRTVECSADHLWSVTTRRGANKILTTKALLDSGLVSPNGNASKYYIKPTRVEFHEPDNLPLDPYLLGVLIGDGSLSKKYEIDISIGLNEEHILDRLVLPTGCSLRKRYYTDSKHYIKATITGSTRKGVHVLGIKSILKKHLDDLGLLDTNSHTKFIPKQYLYSSFKTREQLLQGLIDTDGHINSRGCFEFSTVSKQLYLDFIELCRSLGKVVHSKKTLRKPDDGSYSSGAIYRVTELKGRKHGLPIRSIEKLNKQTEMMCIKVSNDDHLYITDNYVVTHNTTGSTVLAHAIFTEGVKLISTGRNSVEIKRGMDIGTAEITSFLKDNCVPVSSKADISNIGTISANGDRTIGDLLADAIEKVGKDGIITIEPAKSVKTSLDIVEGMQLDSGYVSPFFVTNSDKATCEMNDALVLITPNKISSISEIMNALEISAKENKPLLIIADDVDGEALHTLIVNKTKGVLRVCAVKAPSYGEHRSDILSDLQCIVGGTIFGATTNVSIKNAKMDNLGTAKRVIVSRGNATIIGHNTEEKQLAVKERVESLRTLLTEGSLDALHVDKYRKRLARLSGGIAVVRVGGSTEVEIFEKKDRVEDAVNATLAASREGIVPGGGTALFYASQHLRKLINTGTYSKYSDDTISGIAMIANVCEYPLRVIVENTGVSPDVIIEKLKESSGAYKKFFIDMSMAGEDPSIANNVSEYIQEWTKQNKNKEAESRFKFTFGYNAATGQFTDLVKDGIIDPVLVTRLSLEHANSVVGLLLTCNAVLVNTSE
jgi:chaperonin GroEL